MGEFDCTVIEEPLKPEQWELLEACARDYHSLEPQSLRLRNALLYHRMDKHDLLDFLPLDPALRRPEEANADAQGDGGYSVDSLLHEDDLGRRSLRYNPDRDIMAKYLEHFDGLTPEDVKKKSPSFYRQLLSGGWVERVREYLRRSNGMGYPLQKCL